jgi:hypothetical protein
MTSGCRSGNGHRNAFKGLYAPPVTTEGQGDGRVAMCLLCHIVESGVEMTAERRRVVVRDNRSYRE